MRGHRAGHGLDDAEALRVSEQRRVEVLESISDAFYSLDRDFRFTYVNRRALALWGKEPSELLGSSIWDVFPAFRATESFGRMQAAMVDRRPSTYESYSSFLGTWVNINLYPTDQGLSVFFQDITERKRIERALIESEQQFRAVFELAAVGMAQADAVTGRFLRVNDTFCKITGFEASELVGRRFSDITHPEDRDRDWDEFQRALRGETPDFRSEKRYVRKDGSVVWVHVNAAVLRDDAGNPLRSVAVIEDFSSRVAAEQALRQSEQRWHQLADAMPQLVWTAEPDGTVDYFNRRQEEYSGQIRGADGRWQWVTAVHPDDVETTVAAWTRAVATGDVYEITHRVRCVDGAFRWLLSRGVPLRDAAGRIVKWFGTSTDIHEERLLQAQLSEARETLESRVGQRTVELERARKHLLEHSRHVVEIQETERRLVARELHDEAGQALTAIRLQLALVEREHSGDETLVRRLSELRDIVDDVMVRLHDLSVRLRPAVLDRLGLERSLAQLVEAMRADGLELDFEFAGPPPAVGVPLEIETSLYRIAQESLTNVRRHAGARRAALEVRCRPDEAVIEVRDDGIGLDVDAALNSGRLGIGGMHERVELLGGTLAIESRPGMGTAIRAVIPLPRSETPSTR